MTSTTWGGSRSRWALAAVLTLILAGASVVLVRQSAQADAHARTVAAAHAFDLQVAQATTAERTQLAADRRAATTEHVAAARAAQEAQALADANAVLASVSATLDGSAGKADDPTRAGLSAAVTALRSAIDAKSYDALPGLAATAQSAAGAVATQVAAFDTAAAAAAVAAPATSSHPTTTSPKTSKTTTSGTSTKTGTSSRTSTGTTSGTATSTGGAAATGSSTASGADATPACGTRDANGDLYTCDTPGTSTSPAPSGGSGSGTGSSTCIGVPGTIYVCRPA